MPRWLNDFLVWLIGAPARVIWWALKEMGRQLVGRAKSAAAPYLWPAALLLLLALVYAIGGQQGLDQALVYIVVFGLLILAFRMLLSPFRPKKKKKKK